MAFSTKYRMQSSDLNGSSVTVNFQLDPWAGSITELTPGPRPARLTYNYETSSKYEPIIGSGMEFQVVYEEAVEDLFIEEDRVVRVLVDGPLTNDWYGFLTPIQGTRRMGGSPGYVILKATDQLGSLKSIKFRDGSDDPYFGIEDDLTIIYNILLKTGFQWSLRESVNIYEDAHDKTTADSPLDQTYFYQEMYWDEVDDESVDCYTVLYDILKKYGARLYQRDYQWHIDRPNTLWAKHARRYFNASFSYLSTETEYFQWNKDDNSGVWRATPIITKQPRAGRVEIEANPLLRTNLVKNSTFDDFAQSGGLMLYWLKNSTPAESESDGYWTIGDNDSSSPPDQSVYIENYFYGAKTFSVVIQFIATWTGGTTCVLHFGITDGSGLWWNPTDQSWDGTEVHYELDAVAEFTTSPSDLTTLTIEITHGELGVNGLQVHVFEVFNDNDGTTATIQVHNVRLEPTYLKMIKDSEIVAVDNTAVSYVTIKDEIRQCDSFNLDLTGRDDMWWTLKSGTGLTDNTEDWQIYGDPTTASTIQELLARQYLEGSHLPTETISGTLRGYFDYHEALVDDDMVDSYGYPKVYMATRVTYDYHRMEWSGEWVEVSPIYTDEDLDWASDTYTISTITDNEIDINTDPVSGTDTATSDPYTAVIGEMIRIYVDCEDLGTSDPPNYSIDGQAGTLEFGDNYLEFVMTSAGSKTFQINHTDGESANCLVTFKFYSLIGL